MRNAQANTRDTKAENGSSTTQQWRLRPRQEGRERAADQTERKPRQFAVFPAEILKPRRAMAAQRCWVAADAPAGNGTTSNRRASAAASDAGASEPLTSRPASPGDDADIRHATRSTWRGSCNSNARVPHARACERSPPWTRPTANTLPTTPPSIVPICQTRFITPRGARFQRARHFSSERNSMAG